MSKFVVIAFYTFETPYEDEAEKFKKNVESFGLTVKLQGYPNTGSWVRNAGIKPVFILAMMDQLDTEYLLYLDVDARIRQYPKLFDSFEGDLGVHYRRGTELLSGTIMIRNCPHVHKLIKLWVDLQTKMPDKWDQRILQQLLAIKKKSYNIVDLPPAYTQIYDSMKHYGSPVIEHLQASRRYKNVVSVLHGKKETIPTKIGKVRIRQDVDGTYYIIRRNKEAEDFLDQCCIRLPGERRWYPSIEAKKDVGSLQHLFENQMVYIIGKGPSLDYIQAGHFKDQKAPIVCLNESIHTIEQLQLPNPIMCLQQDAQLRDTCRPRSGCPMLTSIKAANFYADYPKIYVYDPRRYHLALNALSVSAAIKIAISLEARAFTLVSFDACVNKKLEYAKVIGYSPTWGGELKRFLTHRAKIKDRLGDYPAEWIIPEAPIALASCDTPQL